MILRNDISGRIPEDRLRERSDGGPSGKKPFFSFRGWETQVDGLWCDNLGGSRYWYKNPVYLSYLDTVLDEAVRYHANALIFMGRGDFAEIHSFISYRQWPELYGIYENRRKDDRLLQTRRLNEVIEKANKKNVGVYLWSHEIYIPGELPRLYPGVKGVGAPFCPSSPEFWKFIGDKYEEFLEKVPGIAGIFLVLSETQSMLLDGSPCHCDQCRATPPQVFLEKLIRTVYEPLHRHGKRLVIRTFGHSTAHIQRIVDAINRLPDNLDISVMSKATISDFFGFRYPDNPAIGAVHGRPQFLEEAFGEFRGKTHIICIPAKFYTERIRHAAKKGVRGLVFRLEHNGYPKSNFASPDQFNIYLVSQLWLDPYADVDKIWKEWFTSRYGGEASEYLIPAFKMTEDIWERSTNTLGVYVSSAHGNLAPLFRGPYCAWDNLTSSVNNITAGIPEWDALGEKLLHPDDRNMMNIEKEIDEANEMATRSVTLVEKGGRYLSSKDRAELLHYFRLERETAALFGELKKIFFYSLRAEQSAGEEREEEIASAGNATGRAIKRALEMEKKFGRGHWPLNPDDGRGANFYDIVADQWAGCMPQLVEHDSLPRQGWNYRPLLQHDMEKLYRMVLEALRPGTALPVTDTFHLEKTYKEVYFAGENMMISFPDGQRLGIPVTVHVSGSRLTGGVPYVVRVNRDDGGLKISAKVFTDTESALRAFQEGKCDLVRDRIDDIHTLAELEVYKGKVRDRFLKILGPFPERTPLRPVKTGVVDRVAYTIEKIIIESQPGFYIPVNLYIPKGRDLPMPAVLSPLGHAPKGKAHDVNDNYQARFITLARKGYVVCAFDPLGQGEREPYGAKTGNNHYVQGYQCMPSGRHLASYFIWDAMRCIDYLETRPEVDKERIAVAGCSGGGAITNYVAALDDRIALAVPASWISTSSYLTFDSRGLHPESWFRDMCAVNGPGTLQLLACIAPRPLLIIGNQFDPLFPPGPMKVVGRDIRDLYVRLGIGDKMEYVAVPTEHGYWPEARRALYRFLNLHFDKREKDEKEMPVRTEHEAALFCAPEGQVHNLPGAQTVYSLNQEVMRVLRDNRKKRRKEMSPGEYRKFIENSVVRVSGMLPAKEKFIYHEAGNDTVVMEYSPGFFTTAVLFKNSRQRSPVVVFIADDNEEGMSFSRRLAGQGFDVLYVNTRKVQPRYELMTGKLRPGNWAEMILAGIKYMNDQTGEGVAVAGKGEVSAWAVQFAAIAGGEDITAACIIDPPGSLESLSADITESYPLQVMLPGALRWFDESDIAAALAPLPVLFAGVHDKHGKLLRREELKKRYRWSLKNYKFAGSKSDFYFLPGSPSPVAVGAWLKKHFDSDGH